MEERLNERGGVGNSISAAHRCAAPSWINPVFIGIIKLPPRSPQDPDLQFYKRKRLKIHFCGFWSRLCLWTPTCVFKEQHQTKQEYEEIFLSTTMMWRLLLPAGILITYSSHLDLVVQCSLHFVTHCSKNGYLLTSQSSSVLCCALNSQTGCKVVFDDLFRCGSRIVSLERKCFH